MISALPRGPALLHSVTSEPPLGLINLPTTNPPNSHIPHNLTGAGRLNATHLQPIFRGAGWPEVCIAKPVCVFGEVNTFDEVAAVLDLDWA